MAKDQDYEVAVEKGARLLQMLTKKFKMFTKSAFKHTEELAQHGYHLETKQTDFEIECIAKALHDLNVDCKRMYDGGENVRIHHEHGLSAVEGDEYTIVRGYFSQISNPRAGVLIADTNLTPSHAAAFDDTDDDDDEEEEEEEEEDSNLPLLRHWSDIQNSATFSVLNKILKMHGHSTFGLWPGITFHIESEEGKAILGTPNGSGVAWMLIQHSKALGERTIKKVTIFYAPKKGDLFRWPSLLFWIA